MFYSWFVFATGLFCFCWSPAFSQSDDVYKPASLNYWGKHDYLSEGVERTLALIGDHWTMELYEGLPHQNDSKLLQSELKKGDTFNDHGFPFYNGEVVYPKADYEVLRRSILAVSTYRVYTGGGFCGGYHPDFLMKFKDGKNELSIQLCFGCNEVRIYHRELMLEVSLKDYAKLKKILSRCSVKRPDRQPNVMKLKQAISSGEHLWLKSQKVQWDHFVMEKEGRLKVYVTQEAGGSSRDVLYCALFDWSDDAQKWTWRWDRELGPQRGAQ